MEKEKDSEKVNVVKQKFLSNQYFFSFGKLFLHIHPFKVVDVYCIENLNLFLKPVAKKTVDFPHIWKLLHISFKQLTMKKVNQSIIICGKNGSGKTEIFKRCLQYFSALISKISEDFLSTYNDRFENSHEYFCTIIDSFGGTDTSIHCDTTSRFVKLLELKFSFNENTSNEIKWEMNSATITPIIFETSRLFVQQDSEKKNFKIFYTLCNAQFMEFENAENYRILNMSSNKNVEAKTEAEIDIILKSFDSLGFQCMIYCYLFIYYFFYFYLKIFISHYYYFNY
jgi:myosin heavy subunit